MSELGAAAAEARHRDRRAGAAAAERGAERAAREGSRRGAAADGRVVELDEVGRKRADLGAAVAEPQGALIAHMLPSDGKLSLLSWV